MLFIYIYITLFNHPIQIDSIISYPIVGFNPSEKSWTSSVGICWDYEIPNHQPVILLQFHWCFEHPPLRGIGVPVADAPRPGATVLADSHTTEICWDFIRKN